MKLVYTEQAAESLTEALEFISPHVSAEKLQSIRRKILDRADKLIKNPHSGRKRRILRTLRV